MLVCRVEIKIPLVMVDQCWLWHGLVGRSRFATLVFQDGIDTVMYSLLSRVGDELVELVVAWPVWEGRRCVKGSESSLLPLP